MHISMSEKEGIARSILAKHSYAKQEPRPERQTPHPGSGHN